jgi:carboxypeptidase C (cathepsin A)
VVREEREKKGEGEQQGEFEGDRARATIFFVAYTRSDVDDPSARPITFSFNGGPGSSSVWLHMGALGPRRVEMGDVDALAAPPYGLVDNGHSLLDVTDLVFIDPVGTGYSRPVAGEKAKDFHTLDKDVESVGEFIRLYTTRYGRWRSPKFLIGERYGTTRAAGLAPHLHERHGMTMNGVMLVSMASLAAILGPYAAAVNDYVRRELGFESDLPYEVLSLKVNEGWKFERENDYVRITESLRKAMTGNPALKVLVASGLYDLATPPAATDYTIDHLGLPEELRANITTCTYQAGHMMYVHPPSLEQQKSDLASFVRDATPPHG